MSENIQSINPKFEAAIERAFFLIEGKKLFVDHSIGFTYFTKLVHNLEYGVVESDRPNFIEILTSNGQVITTADMYNAVNDKLTDVPKGSIVKVKLNDYMAVNDNLCGYGVERIADNVNNYRKNGNVIGAIVEINSGGGEGAAGQIMFNAVKDFGSVKPIISLINTAGSAAFMPVAGSTEAIGAGLLSSAGSIGVYASLNKKLAKFMKENYQDVYSDESDDKNLWWREYVNTGNTDVLKQELNDYALLFQKMVSDNMNLTAKYKDKALRGGMFMAEEAKKMGLIHLIGTESLAVKRVQSLAR